MADNAWAYIVEYAVQPNGVPQNKTFTDPHDVVLADLVSGTNYKLRVAVMGSGNQATEFCDAVTHMAT